MNNLYYKIWTNLSCEVVVAAYIDDTNWFAPSRKNMEKILNITDEFYIINDITINKFKSYLIVINTENIDRDIGINIGDDNLKPIDNNSSVCSLRVFAIGSGSQKIPKRKDEKDGRLYDYYFKRKTNHR